MSKKPKKKVNKLIQVSAINIKHKILLFITFYISIFKYFRKVELSKKTRDEELKTKL